jgi:hypothetical protein
MKTSKAFLAALLLLGNIAVASKALAADGVIEKQELFPGSNYCHMQFRAMDPNTLGFDDPSLKSSDSADVIDFYGPCDESPTGDDQVWEQKQDQFNWQNKQ